jgi:ABC-2 type transport system ATP-binding protein
MQEIVKIKNLCKKYNKRYILKDINLEVEKGVITGILGQNGSGKSTLMKIISGIEKPDSGEVLINGTKPGISTKSQVAFLTENNQLYDWMYVNDAIKFHQDFFGDFDVEKCEKLIDFMDITDNYRIKKLSKGMLQRLRLSLTLARNASVYLLDEPFMGIDTITRDKIIKAINNYYCEDSCVIITTHLISEVERILDRVSFISDGSIALSGDCEELRFEKNQSIEDMYRKLYA